MAGRIGIHDFKPGMAVEVTYITPDHGRPALNLEDKHGNFVLRVAPRWIEKVVILNTRIDGCWGSEERTEGFDFSTGVPVTVRVEAKHENYRILCNGKVIHTFTHKRPLESVVSAMWESSGKQKVAQLLSMKVCY